jgi:DNA (cytosine-5)-methyltransferase 1
MSNHRFDWKWYLKDLNPNKDINVLTTFSCGGGSSMGYKRAGFHVIGNVEIDPKINAMYVKNHHPKYNFNMDLRKFNEKEDIPEELYHLDILDGSPPCTTFSMAGDREDTWGKKKKFNEGQVAQTLDDLFFTFLDTVERLKPKVVVAENVVGLIQGNAKGYVNLIIKRFKELGYEVQIFNLNAARMDVPQSRRRIFFVANRMGYPKLKLDFHYDAIPFGEVRSEHGKPAPESKATEHLASVAKEGEISLEDAYFRLTGKRGMYFTHKICHDNNVSSTVTAKGEFWRMCDVTKYTDEDYRNVQSFPQDYDFCDNKVQYVCGMSVPPNMMANIATEIYDQWLNR